MRKWSNYTILTPEILDRMDICMLHYANDSKLNTSIKSAIQFTSYQWFHSYNRGIVNPPEKTTKSTHTYIKCLSVIIAYVLGKLYACKY